MTDQPAEPTPGECLDPRIQHHKRCFIYGCQMLVKSGAIDTTKLVARVIDWAPFDRQDENWNGEGSPLWEHFHRTDVSRIASAMNRAKEVLSLLLSITAAPSTAAERDRLKVVNEGLVKALEELVGIVDGLIEDQICPHRVDSFTLDPARAALDEARK